MVPRFLIGCHGYAIERLIVFRYDRIERERSTMKRCAKASGENALAWMKAAKQRDTKAETNLAKRLSSISIAFEHDCALSPKSKRKADFVFESVNVAVYVDGCFWHACPIHETQPKANAKFWQKKLEANKARDRDINEALKAGS